MSSVCCVWMVLWRNPGSDKLFWSGGGYEELEKIEDQLSPKGWQWQLQSLCGFSDVGPEQLIRVRNNGRDGLVASH